MPAPSTTQSHCKNPKVVHVGHRLHSPDYNIFNKIFPTEAMCYFGVCNRTAYNAWIEATDAYVKDHLIPRRDEVIKEINDVYGEGMPPQEMADTINKLNDMLADWDENGPEVITGTEGILRLPQYWQGRTLGVVRSFDEFACASDWLDEILIELDRPTLTKGHYHRKTKEIMGDKYLGGTGQAAAGGSQGRSAGRTVIGIAALTVAGYMGYKVLTE